MTEKFDKSESHSIEINLNDIKETEIRLQQPHNKTQFIEKWMDENDLTQSVYADDISSIPEDSNSTASIDVLSERLEEVNIKSIEDTSSITTHSDRHFRRSNGRKSSSVATASDLNNICGLKETINQISHVSSQLKNIGNVRVENSRDIHIGNVTYITGPIHITNTGGGHIGVINQTQAPSHSPNGGAERHSRSKDSKQNLANDLTENSSLFSNIKCVFAPEVLRVVPRIAWLAQKPAEAYDAIKDPVPYVIISHTATENPATQAGNVHVIRYIQCFHIESLGWNDIGYNFLVGGDGQVYHGRGWGVVGAHAKGYNIKSVGISFVGCYTNELPTETSLNTCKLLIQSGVDQGYIAENYKLLAHCQCCPTESPGRMLLAEITKWPHFSSSP